LHADEGAIEEAAAAVSGADCVVVVGSGTITNVGKKATARVGAPPLVILQTAASVNAFSDDMACCSRGAPSARLPRAGLTPFS
jgi:glycerol-1-phosphate dehydrogenase [NAD(P)+]